MRGRGSRERSLVPAQGKAVADGAGGHEATRGEEREFCQADGDDPWQREMQAAEHAHGDGGADQGAGDHEEGAESSHPVRG